MEQVKNSQNKNTEKGRKEICPKTHPGTWRLAKAMLPVKGHHCESLSMNQDLADLGVSASYETGGRGWCALVNTTLTAEVTSIFEEYCKIMLIMVSITYT